MDWEFKPSTWDFGEPGQVEDGFVGGSSRLGVQENAGAFSVDLKLGGSIEKSQEPKGSSSSSGSSSKRASFVNGGAQNGSCLVEGCTADLSCCREYYRRHRVCERHSKTPIVTVRGRQQRFCQQCSRFQSLEEFDEEKRSCRKRLDGHNRRRRKPNRRPFQMSSGSLLSNHQGYSLLQTHQGGYDGLGLSASNGARLLQFSATPSYTTSAAGSVPTWPAKQEQQDLHFTNHQQQTVIPNSSACIDTGGEKTFPFLLPNDPGRSNQTVPEVPLRHRLLHNDHKALSGELTDSVVSSKRALSLLSTRVISSNRPVDGGPHFDGTAQCPRSSNTGSVLYDTVFHGAPDDMLEKGAAHVLPFSWK